MNHEKTNEEKAAWEVPVEDNILTEYALIFGSEVSAVIHDKPLFFEKIEGFVEFRGNGWPVYSLNENDLTEIKKNLERVARSIPKHRFWLMPCNGLNETGMLNSAKTLMKKGSPTWGG